MAYPEKSEERGHGSEYCVPHLEIIGYFSVDKDKNYLPGSSKLKYFCGHKGDSVDFDLDYGRDNLAHIHDTLNHADLSLTLMWISKNRNKLKAAPESDRLLQVNFVSAVGSLAGFMTAPYSPTKCWRVRAAKWKGTIYIHTATDYECRALTPSLFFWEHKFKQYVLSDSPDKFPDATKPIKPHEEFRCVYQHEFSNHSVLYSASRSAVFSMNALADPLPLQSIEFVDVKIAKKIKKTTAQRKKLRRDVFLHWWVNAFLTNESIVLCGLRDTEGIVKELASYEISELPRASEEYWNAEQCIQTCETILSELAKLVVNDCDETTYELTKVGHDTFEVKELNPLDHTCVVPEWYKRAMTE